jgi:hypothetical protein
MRRRNHQTAIAFILFLILTSISSAQKVEVSAVGGTMIIAGGAGVRLKIGPQIEGWHINGALTILYVEAGDLGGFKPGGTIKFLLVTPYTELSPSRWLGIGFSPISVIENKVSWFPLAMLTANFPITINDRFDLLPSIQLQLLLRESPLPFVFIGLGAVFSLD